MESKEKTYLRNRKIANGILILSAVLTLATLGLERVYGRSLLLSFFQFLSEAVLIASVADGIAIYALTHKIPLPFLQKYTGLVQNKRKELLEGVVRASEEQFFTKDSILEKMENIESRKLLDLGKKAVRERVQEGQVEEFISGLIENHKKEWSVQLEKQILEKLEEISLENQLAFLEKQEFKDQQVLWLSSGIDFAKGKIGTEHSYKWIRDELRKMVLDRRKEGSIVKRMMKKATFSAMEKTKTIEYSELAKDIQRTLMESLSELQLELQTGKGQHGDLLQREFQQMIDEVKNNPKILEEMEHWKKEMIHNLPLRKYLENGLDFLSNWIREGKNLQGNRTFSFGKIFGDSFERVVDEMEEKGDLSKEIKSLMARLFESQYESILMVLEELLLKLSNDHIIKKINDIAGGNLQWLRISGAYVGGVVGIGLFLIIYFPILFIPLSMILFFILRFSPTLRKKLVYYEEEEE
ncbi:MAG: DUF445 family protein [Gallicola sp.]|nr:DUF445 family protein [Gallicola sp.]